MQTHDHPHGGAKMSGFRLAPGAILKDTDVFASTSGVWEPCPSPNLKLGETSTLWVRPQEKLSTNARLLLAYLVRAGDRFRCVVQRNSTGGYILAVSPSFNWDGRVTSTRLDRSEGLQELVDFGFLAASKHPIINWHSDHSMASEGDYNLAFTLTAYGKHEGAKILAR